jgi:hypothetical protein
MAELDLHEIQATLIDLAFEAGRMITGANVHDISLGTKLNCQHPPLSPPLVPCSEKTRDCPGVPD